MTTDSTGHAYLRYWAPAVCEKGIALMKAAATCTTPCAACACSRAKERSGTLDPPLQLTVHDQVIYQHTSPALPFAAAVALYLWSHDEDNELLKIIGKKAGETALLSPIGDYLEKSVQAWQLIEMTSATKTNTLLGALEAAEARVATLKLVETGSLVILLAEVTKFVWDAELVRTAEIDDFFTYTRLFPAGLDPVDTSATSSPDQPSSALEQAIASSSTGIPFLKEGTGTGLWFELGKALYVLKGHGVGGAGR